MHTLDTLAQLLHESEKSLCVAGPQFELLFFKKYRRYRFTDNVTIMMMQCNYPLEKSFCHIMKAIVIS